jgi:hypothetical protein
VRVPLAALAAVCSLAFAWAYLVQPSGDNQKAHYLLVRALADGRATVDADRPASGPLATGDVVEQDGHLYAAKAPGLAFASVPAYVVARAVGVSTEGDPIRMLWVLHLWVVVLPAALLLVLVIRVGERIEPAAGAPAAVTLGLATLLLPFGTLLFAHVLAATLGFAAFVLLWSDRGARPLHAAAAGVLAGLAVTTDYPLALVAGILGLYALRHPRVRLRRALAYGLGLVAGAAPLFAFNLWAFGSALHFPYEGWHEPGAEPLSGVFGISAPSVHDVLTLLFVPAGLAALAPAIVGAVLLYRRGWRAETLVVAAVVSLYVLYNAGFVDLFGGASPGPRYLIPVLPFLAVPLALAFRCAPAVTIGIAVGAAVVQAVYTVTTPLAAWDGHALDRFRDGSFVPTLGDYAGVPRPYDLVPFALALVAAAAFAAKAAGARRVTRRDAGRAVVGLAAWALPAWQAPRLLFDRTADRSGLVLLLVTVGVVAVGAVYARPLARAVATARTRLRGRRGSGSDIVRPAPDRRETESDRQSQTVERAR